MKNSEIFDKRNLEDVVSHLSGINSYVCRAKDSRAIIVAESILSLQDNLSRSRVIDLVYEFKFSGIPCDDLVAITKWVSSYVQKHDISNETDKESEIVQHIIEAIKEMENCDRFIEDNESKKEIALNMILKIYPELGRKRVLSLLNQFLSEAGSYPDISHYVLTYFNHKDDLEQIINDARAA